MNRFRLLTAAALLFLAAQPPALAGSATWSRHPASNDWQTATNWVPATVPNSTTDNARFDTSSVMDPVLIGSINLASLSFGPRADAFTITLMPTDDLGTVLFLNDTGITNTSGKLQTFIFEFGTGMVFYNSATAGKLVTYSAMPGAHFFSTISPLPAQLALMSATSNGSRGSKFQRHSDGSRLNDQCIGQ